MAIDRFDSLYVYRTAFESAAEIYDASKEWPKEERYALTDQIRRSSRSVSANIAEAWHKRRYQKYFVSKLSDADAEVAETRVWLQFALTCTYITEDDFERLNGIYHKISSGLVKMMINPEKWCGPSGLVEETTTYESSPSPPHSPQTPHSPHSSHTAHTPDPPPCPASP